MADFLLLESGDKLILEDGSGDLLLEPSVSGVNIGVYDAEMRDQAWFDTSALMEGWWDYGMPFEHDLITAPTPPPAGGTWPGWVISSSSGWF